MEFWTEKIIGGKMKVTGVKTYVIENESAPRSGGGEETGNCYIGGKYFLILELSTDEGIIGLGEKLTGSSFTGNMTWKDFKSQIQLVHETVEAFVIFYRLTRNRSIFCLHMPATSPNLWVPKTSIYIPFTF